MAAEVERGQRISSVLPAVSSTYQQLEGETQNVMLSSMRQLLLPLEIFRDIRVRSFLRREFPLLFFIVPLVVGQLVGYELRALYEHSQLTLSAGLILALVVLLLKYPGTRMPLLLGVLTITVTIASRPAPVSSPAKLFARLIRDPRHYSIGSIEGQYLLSDSRSGKAYGNATCKAIYLPWRNISHVQAGDTILVNATLAPIELPYNPFSFEANQRRHGIVSVCRISTATQVLSRNRPWFSALREQLFTRLVERFGSGERIGLFLSMVLGFRDLIGGEVSHAFQATGLAHLLVVSGYHVTLIFSVLLFCLRWLVRRGCLGQPDLLLPALALAWIGALIFVGFIGIDSASLRAALAVCIVVASRLLERGNGLAHGIQLAFLALVIIWPGCFVEPGVQLTFAALIGIAWGLSSRSPRRWLRYLAVSMAPSLTTLGITIFWFESASLAGFILNPLIAPAASLFFTIGGLAALLLFLSGLDRTGLLMELMLEPLSWFRDLIVAIGNQSWAAIALEGPGGQVIGVAALAAVSYLILRSIMYYLIEMGIARVP